MPSNIPRKTCPPPDRKTLIKSNPKYTNSHNIRFTRTLDVLVKLVVQDLRVAVVDANEAVLIRGNVDFNNLVTKFDFIVIRIRITPDTRHEAK